MPHRDDHEAALMRADALEVELERERADRSERVERLEAEIAQARSTLAHMEHELARLGPAKQPVPPRPREPQPQPQPPEPTRSSHDVPVATSRPASPIAFAVVGLLVVVAITIAIVAAAAGGRSRSAAGTRDEQPQPQPAPPFRADPLVHDGLAMIGTNRVSKIAIDYVGRDGLLDPSYGAISIETTRPRPPKPPDDPSRPTGAPTGTELAGAEMLLEHCAAPRWSPQHGWTATDGSCMAIGTPPADGPTCTPSQILAQARTDGAPDGLARITVEWTMTMASGDVGFAWQWTFQIDDANRGIDFKRTYGDCALRR